MQPQVSPLLSNGRRYGAAVALPLDAAHPTLFDGALIIPSASRREKIRFIKGAEFFGDRTINIIPETPTGGTNAGISSPYREHLGYWFYAQMGVLSPWAEFYRTIELPSDSQSVQGQQLIFQQINERFLEMNGLDPDADLYKLERRANPRWEKHTNLAEGNASINELLAALNTSRRQTIETRFNLDNMLAYSAASIFTSNWDGYWQNHWMYLDPASADWEMYPWDLDWIWGATPPANAGAMYAEMPLSFPIDGVAVGFTKVSRPKGPVTSPMHQDAAFYEAYIQRLADTFETTFGQDFLFAKMDEDQQRLLDDLALLNQQTGRNVDSLVQQIQQSYETLRTYIVRRRAFLGPLLPK
jgi:spore coat protein CotH